jgi:hypothetical protein
VQRKNVKTAGRHPALPERRSSSPAAARSSAPQVQRSTGEPEKQTSGRPQPRSTALAAERGYGPTVGRRSRIARKRSAAEARRRLAG